MASKRPNILLITSDQQHANALGARNPELRTPTLDRLAREGTAFPRAYCPNPTCTPTRASIITGLYPSQHGAWSLGTKLPEDVHTVGEDFRAAGYTSSLIGKAHFQPLRDTPEFPSLEAYPTLQDLDFWRDFHGPWYGFDHIELCRNHTDEAHVGQHYALWLEANGFTEWRDCFQEPTGTREPQRHRWNVPERFHYGTWIAERTIARLEQHAAADEPFFLWASFFDPHPSYLVPEPWDRLYDPAHVTVPDGSADDVERMVPPLRETRKPRGEADFSAYDEPGGNALHGMHSHVHDRAELARDIAVYYGMISLMDAQIGRILDRLDALGLAEDTLVVFTSDHGHFHGHHGLVAKGPFHFEDVIRVPFLVRWPGRVPAGAESQALQSLVDLAPSFLSACGIPVPRGMTGLDQSAVWRAERAAARDHALVENHHNPTTVHLRTLVTAEHKLTVYYNRPYGELFDLHADPGEHRNLWDDPAAANLKSELLLRLLYAELGREPLPVPRTAGA
jgi:arylsulfatase A-like enzyme